MTPGRTIADLPLELYFQIFFHLSAQDVINFLSTCRAYYSTIGNDTIWRIFSSRDYGVDDLSIFRDYHTDPERFTFRTVYTRFLHAYGPLLGLWASDHPFRGNILEFRIMTKEEYPGLGIIGEVWRFPGSLLVQDNMDPTERDRPSIPSYWEAVYIFFRGSSIAQGSLSDSEYTSVLFPWQHLDYTEEHNASVINFGYKATMYHLGETTQSYYVWYGAGPTESSYSLHPEFPATICDP